VDVALAPVSVAKMEVRSAAAALFATMSADLRRMRPPPAEVGPATTRSRRAAEAATRAEPDRRELRSLTFAGRGASTSFPRTV